VNNQWMRKGSATQKLHALSKSSLLSSSEEANTCPMRLPVDF